MKKNYLFYIVIFFTLFFSSPLKAQSELFIAENGSDTNSGSIDEPLATLIGARDKARETGAKTIWIRGGRYSFDETCNLGSQDNGMSFSGYNDELVIFDGNKFIDSQGFEMVSTPAELDRLNPKAVGKVESLKIDDPDLIALLDKPTAQISINDKMKTLARFPNIGFSHIRGNTIDTSSEIGNTQGTYNDPKGAVFNMVETINSEKWNSEIQRTKRVATKGYMSAVWLKENNRLHSVNASGKIKFVDGSRYGLLNGGTGKIRRFFVYNMLYELDEPGEWYFDVEDSKLYVWFDETRDNNTNIGVWAGPQLFEIRDASDITVKKMTIQNLGKQEGGGKGAINVIGSSDNILVAGVRFRFIAEHMTAFNIWKDVTNSTVKSCDIYDGGGSRLQGGKVTSTSIIYGRNKVENCHFTQVFSKDFYGGACGINGAGNIFRNNLIHNMNGQPVTHVGVDHLIERNEAFNVGIEEGDGGAFYTGNAVWSYGNTIKHNFVHHIMSVPKLLGRAAFFSDDFDGGESVIENVLYKGGWESIKMNKGAGHSVFRNVLLDCFIGIRNGDDTGSNYQTAMDYITNNNPEENIKNNYIGRMLKAIGTSDWKDGLTTENWNERVEPFWTDRYPKMKIVFNKYNNNNRMRPYECRYYENLFWSNNEDIVGANGVEGVRDSKSIGLDLFQNPNNLNFKFKEPRPAYAPNIPFENIGLYLDEYRCAVPNKAIYRRNVKQRFNGQASHTSDDYNFSTINDRLYYNSGEMVYETIPCANVLPEIAEEEEYRFDLGTSNSKVFNEYIRVSNTTKGINFGWNNTEGLQSRDRGNGPNDINRDLVQSKEVRVFEARVVNGNWNVLVTFGDKDFTHDNIQVKAEGEVVFSNVNTQPNVFFNREANVDVVDGKLSLEFSDQGGSDEFWQANRILLRRNGDVLSTKDNALDELVEIYPNPADDILNISYSKQIKKASFVVLDNLGRTVVIENNIKNESKLDIGALSSGLYFIKIKLDDQQITKRFIKQ